MLRRMLQGVAIAISVAVLFSGCGAKRTAITMAGSTAFQPFAEQLAEQFMKEHAGINVTVQGGGSAVGIQSAISGASQIGMADLVTLPPEAQALTGVIVARDGIAVVVNPANPVKNLTLAQVRDIYNGQIKNWKELGGADTPITVVSREAGSGTRSSFEQLVGGIHLLDSAIIQDSNGTVRETVANDANAVAYLSLGLVNDKIHALTLEGVTCTDAEILAGKYHLVRPIYLLTKGAPAGASKELIDYILSPAGQKIVQDKGLIPAH